MANISQLGDLNSSEPLDLSMYADVKESTFTLPKKGRYTVISPESFPSEAFGKTKAGNLSIQVDPTIVGPTNEGFNLRFINVSAKTYQRGGQTVSQVGDYLRAHGLRGAIPGSPQDLADAVEQTAGRVYETDLDWRVYNSKTGFSLEGMEKFPSDGNGGYQSWIEDPTKDDSGNLISVGEDGQPIRLRARLFVRRFVPAN